MPIVLPELPDPDADEATPYCVIAKHRAVPGTADALEQRMRADPGCLQFHIHRDRFDSDLFVIYEIWRDIHALRAHFDTDTVRRFVDESAPYEAGDMDVQWLRMASPYAAGHG